MNVSYNWLKDYIETDLGYVEAAKVLTRIGLNVDSLEDLPDGDGVLDVEVTQNRPDCLGHVGVARELAAALGTRVRLPEVTFPESDEACADAVGVQIEDLDLCPLYTARVVRGVKVGPSPDWLARRLEAVGVRPVNNIVDVTNYVLMETGQPLHAFDLAGIRDGRIIVRCARDGEHFVAIDHTEHDLTPQRLVIADATHAVALAGVMGGAETEISDSTTAVLLEAAVFDPLSIRNTSRALAMMSESSFRFERRVDPCGTDWASRRACQLMVEAAGGVVARGVVAVGAPLPEPVELVLRVPRIETLLGVAVPGDVAADILAHLECEVLEATAERIRVRVPSWRPDLEREVDLIEEVARHHGYDKIPEGRRTPITISAPTKAERVREIVGHVLTAAGYFEAVTFSFTGRARAVRFRASDVTADPLTCRGTTLALRESLLAGVMESLRVNRGAGEADAKLFEVAKRFVPVEGQQLPREEQMLALAGPDDFATVRGVVEAVLDALRLGGRIAFAATDRYPDLEPGAAAEIELDAKPLGMIGRATEEAAEAFDLDEPPVVAEIRYERLVEAADLEPTAEPLPHFPAITRDLALIVDEAVTWADVERAVAAAEVLELEFLEPVDVYRGKQVPPGKKSVAVRLILRSPDATLTHEQADEMQARILAALDETVGAVLRA